MMSRPYPRVRAQDLVALEECGHDGHVPLGRKDKAQPVIDPDTRLETHERENGTPAATRPQRAAKLVVGGPPGRITEVPGIRRFFDSRSEA